MQLSPTATKALAAAAASKGKGGKGDKGKGGKGDKGENAYGGPRKPWGDRLVHSKMGYAASLAQEPLGTV